MAHTNTRRLQDPGLKASIESAPIQGGEAAEVALMPGFPRELTAGLLFCPADNINTDGIYPVWCSSLHPRHA